MHSFILRVATRLIFPVLLLFSVFLFLRGHNLPGGGFIGGLVAAAAIMLELVAWGPQQTRLLFPLRFRRLGGLGLLVAILAGLSGLVSGQPFLKGIWQTVSIPGLGQQKLGTPLLFDLGVYVVVIGVTVEVMLSLAEEAEWK